MKKFLAIFLMFLYANIAFSIGIDCSYCNGKLTHFSIHGVNKSACSCDSSQMNMGCCGTKTLSCKSETHNNQVVSISFASISDHVVSNDDQSNSDILPAGIFVESISDNNSVLSKSSRDILSFIHTLRI